MVEWRKVWNKLSKRPIWHIYDSHTVAKFFWNVQNDHELILSKQVKNLQFCLFSQKEMLKQKMKESIMIIKINLLLFEIIA